MSQKNNKFSEELKKLPDLLGTDSLSTSELAVNKSRILQAMTLPWSEKEEPGYFWTEKREKAARYVISALLGLTLLGGTAFASSTALPGGSLYPVKRLEEKLEYALAFSQSDKAQVQYNTAQDRLEELSALTLEQVTVASPQQPGQSVPTPVEQALADSSLETKARADAAAEVTSALSMLRVAQSNALASGNSLVAAAFSQDISNLTMRALKLHVLSAE